MKMEEIKELVIIGEKAIGKTTLANALLGWDIFPQSYGGVCIPTKENASQMLTEHIRLTDTPGYDLWEYRVPEEVEEAVCRADIIIFMFKELGAEEDADWEPTDPEDAEEIRRWLVDLAAEIKLQKGLLAKAKTRDIYFVIPFDSEYCSSDRAELEQDLARGKTRFASFSDHGDGGFFCIDPTIALLAEIEADQDALARSGFLPLKTAVLKQKEMPYDKPNP